MPPSSMAQTLIRLGYQFRRLANLNILFPPRPRPDEYELLPTSSTVQPSSNQDKMSRKFLKRNALITIVLVPFLLMVGGASAGVIRRPSNSTGEYPKLIDATIETLTKGLQDKKFTSVDLVNTYIARIAEVDKTLNAVNEINPDALIIAEGLDTERRAGKVRGPLHGIPILIKDNIATNDTMNTTAGSYALLGAKVPSDATVVQKLRAAGAIVLGKTNLSQWANFRSLNTSNGWSAVGGQSHGPYLPGEDPWGSSSGSAISSALGLALGSLGTETDGSITSPSSYNNLVGIKPTVGLTSRHLVIPISEHQDTVGPLTRTVKDAAHLLQAIAGSDPQDNYTSAIPFSATPNYVEACKLSGLSKLRLGIPRNVISTPYDSTTRPILETFEKALDIIQTAGATIVENTNFTAAADFEQSKLPTRVLEADFVVGLQRYLDLLTYNPNNITSLASLHNFTEYFPAEDYTQRDTGIWDEALQSWNNTDPRFWPVYQQNLYFGEEGGLLGALERNSLDAIVLPAKYATDWAAPVGTPIVTVPMGFYPPGSPIVKNSWGLIEAGPNIPFGLSFLGAKFTEEKLIGMAYAFEQRTEIRNKVHPYIVPTTELPKAS